MSGHLEEPKLAQLQRIVQNTGAKVVLSTDWRRQAPLKKQLHGVLGKLGIEIIGATPMRAMFQPIRPQEITSWLSNKQKTSCVGTWVAIDDRDLVNEIGGANLRGHFVRTHPASGLTQKLADMAIGILQQGGRESPPLSCSPGSSPSRAHGFDDLEHLAVRTPKMNCGLNGERRRGQTASFTPPWTRSSDVYGAFNGNAGNAGNGLLLSATQPLSPMTRVAPRAPAFNNNRPLTQPLPHGGMRSVGAAEVSSPMRRGSPAAERAGSPSIWSSGQRAPAAQAAALPRSPSRDPSTSSRWRSAEKPRSP
eukprot:CAMPEP_0119361042 /NCGR_PEP_ID=MMETSP1334-20130426/8458_1 /TAXON_ID=127549 /ORGANISM="Calcidiscus leptoporus, Strain RCC1130" /LENGTH=306 /DNA_ID=CAMNT_0007375969 /DNA_START=162 /DNA_END=1082 /DNA_ORIENTATION=-